MDSDGPFSLSHSFEKHLRAKNLSDGWRHPSWVVVGGARPVGLAEVTVAGPPAVGGGAGDAHLGRDMGRPASGEGLAQD